MHGEDKDEIVGILLAKDLLRGVVVDNGPGDIHGLMRPAVLIPESKKLNVLLKEFRQSRNHMAIVIDEHGGVVRADHHRGRARTDRRARSTTNTTMPTKR